MALIILQTEKLSLDEKEKLSNIGTKACCQLNTPTIEILKSHSDNQEITQCVFEHMESMLDQIQETGMFFKIIKDSKLIGGFCLRSWMEPAMKDNFFSKWSNNPFVTVVMNNWLDVMSKYFVTKQRIQELDLKIAHQALQFIDPEFAGKGIGKDATKQMFKILKNMGYHAWVSELSSVPVVQMMEHIKQHLKEYFIKSYYEIEKKNGITVVIAVFHDKGEEFVTVLKSMQ